MASRTFVVVAFTMAVLSFLVYHNFEIISKFSVLVSLPANTKIDPVKCRVFGLVTDLDHESRNPQKFEWFSKFKKIKICFNQESGMYKILNYEDPFDFTTQISRKNRSMELSSFRKVTDRIGFGFGDYTGFVFQLDLVSGECKPIVFLPSGDGTVTLPFKCEWSTYISENEIMVGSIGKEWVVGGKSLHTHCEWVKILTLDPEDRTQIIRVDHLDWSFAYRKIREVLGYSEPGYFVHEAIFWDFELRKWIILPRKASKELYEESKDELKGSNLLILASEDFTEIEHYYVGTNEMNFGFSSVVKIPFLGSSDHHYVGIKVRERFHENAPGQRGKVSTRDITQSEPNQFVVESKLVVFDEKGNLLSKEFDLGFFKFEGIDFLQVLE